MGNVTITKTKDRVTVSYDRTINIGNYESVKVHAGYGTDVLKDETVEEAFQRAEKVASEQLEAFTSGIEHEVKQRRK